MINTFLIPKSAKIWSSHALPIKKNKGNLDGMSRDRPLGDEFHYHLTLPEYLIFNLIFNLKEEDLHVYYFRVVSV